MRSERGGFIDRLLESPVIWFITALNLGIFGIAWSRGEMVGGDLTRETLLAFGANARYHIWSGEYWRLLSAVFLHVGVIHLLWNTWAMFGWCAGVERTVGSAWFTFAYLSTGIGASAVSVLSHHVISAGASGAGFGMISVTLSMLYRRAGSWEAFMANPFVKQVLVNTAIWVAIGFTAVAAMDNYAHLGGFAFGIPCGLLVESRRGRKRSAWFVALAAYILVWGGVVVAACIPGVGIG